MANPQAISTVLVHRLKANSVWARTETTYILFRPESTFCLSVNRKCRSPWGFRYRCSYVCQGLFKNFLWGSVDAARRRGLHGSAPNFPRELVRGRAAKDVAEKLVDGFSHSVGAGLAQAAGHDHTFSGAAQAHDVAVPGEVPGGSRAHLGSRRDESSSNPVAGGSQLRCPFGVSASGWARQDRDGPLGRASSY